ncbi:ubiquitin-related domain-containing protein [Lactarius hengduanensis]|nr:ubiquitin-related domain-containing protein [Lactarius hengduanensis]
MDHHLSPPHRPPHHEMSLPTFSRSIPVEVAAQPASTRTSFTRVDNTRPGTSAGDDSQRDEAGPNVEGARESLHNEPEEEEAAATAPVPQIPQTMLQFLLVSGRRRSMGFEPETTVGRVKELVWNSWPNDWQDERPPAPSYLRILHLGKILQDDDTLLQLKFPSHTPPEPATPTIVHLSVRSFVPRGDSAVKKKRRNLRSAVDVSETGADAETGEHAGSCCCVIC